MSEDLIFCSCIFPGYETDSLLLAESVRHFGGTFAGRPMWMMTPDFGKPLSNYAVSRLRDLNVRIIPFKIERDELRFFFTGELTGLAHAESLAAAETDLLVWMDANTIMVNEPDDLVLPPGKSFGYRPVHLLILGSRYSQPLDPFWSRVYRDCAVPEDRVFSMQPVAEDLQMRLYFNAGLLAIRPRFRLLQKWYEKFTELKGSADYLDFYKHDKRYEVFLHQALLTGMVLNTFTPEEMSELPATYNYPIHLFDKDTTNRRPRGMDTLVTFRHEGFYDDPDWKVDFPSSERLKDWLAEQLSQIKPA